MKKFEENAWKRASSCKNGMQPKHGQAVEMLVALENGERGPFDKVHDK